MHKIYFFLLLFICGFVSQAQVQNAVQDTIKKGYDVGEIQMANPKSILSAYTYDPVTNTYIYTNSVDDFNINYPIVLTPAEYEKLMLKESMNQYFGKKLDAIDGNKKGSDAAKKDLLPRYYIKSGLFESIFGSNTIDVKPTGSIEVDLGLLYTKQDNPAFSPRNRTNTSFDFNQRISMSLLGKVGTRLQVNANFDTQSTFAFQNLLKLEYTPGDDDIVRKIEVGNVSMPLNSTLIQGAQSLFGVKTELQFGKTTVTGVFSEQKSQAKKVTAQGGGTIQEFEMYGLDYDNDRHFFLSQYFREKYDASLKNYPFVDSRVQITRLEVWVTNKQNRVNTTSNNLRNIIALQDLGEGELADSEGNPIIGKQNEVVVLNPIPAGFFVNQPPDIKKSYPSDNKNNLYDPALIKTNAGYLNDNIREIVTAKEGFSSSISVSEGQDYSKLENARKLLPNEYTFNAQLGYISLQQRLGNDEILAVAYQYSIGDKVYQVGEFGNDGVEATVVGGNQPSNQTVISQTLILKMLKSSLTNVANPVWNLMMKNIYQIQGAYQLVQEDFRLNILYKNPSALNYITPVAGTPFPSNPTPENTVENTTLLKVLNLDKLNYNNDPQTGGDGFFDFIPGMTVDSQNGRLIFTTKEPFGQLLFSKLKTQGSAEDYNDVTTYNDNQKKYVNPYMYRVTQAKAIQYPELNKFLLRGKYKSVGGDGIPIGAFNVPLGSVKVTAAGRVLVEGVDYSVNYQLGKVQILDPSLQASNTPIEISLENNSVFGQQTRRFFGVNVDHLISENFMVGATFLNLKEKPFTQKSSYGQESVDNSIFGLHGNYSSQVPFFTRLVNKLPNIDTDAPSSIAVSGEFAYLMPNASKGDKFQGESTIYVDDFESSQSSIDLRSPYAWTLSSTPANSNRSAYNFNGNLEGLDYGFKRAKLSWYSIDPVFYTSKPSGITNDDLSTNATRRVYSEELYPLTDIAQGQSLVVNTLDLSYYPKERGPYNNNLNVGDTPNENYGGIVRSLSSTNFEQSNVEYIQFWVMDPYVGAGKTSNTNSGKIYFNLGEISEDVLKDGRKVYENGFGPDQVLVNPAPVWGNAPASQSLIYAFDNNEGNRTNQDIGFDGLASKDEAKVYTNYASDSDPAADDYTYYQNTKGSVLDRYKNYNGVENNSTVNINSPNRGSTTIPDVEDVNRDNTMNTINAYYEYSIDMKPDMKVGQNYISDERNTVITLPNGSTTDARWIQFKIPISQPQDTIGKISDFRSIRFMRMFMTNFTDKVTLRFGALDLMRGEWRRYANSLDSNDLNVGDDATVFETASVNIEENSNKCPINYVSPPSVKREQLYNNNTVINQDEQSLSMRISGGGLEPLDGRGAFKSFNIDMRQYNKLKMFLHAESLPFETVLKDNQMVAFLRIGADYSNDFYQIEIPLKVTAASSSGDKNCPPINADLVWPTDNEIDLSLALLTDLKLKSLKIDKTALPADGIYYSDDDPNVEGGDGDGKLRLGIKGNPNLGLIRNIMLGVKSNEPHQDIKGEVWFNELRLADMDNKGGIAALLNIDTNFADLATVSMTGNIKDFGFGTIEQGPNERSREDIQQYNIVTNINLGRFLPKKWGINLPFNYSIGEEIIKPEYDPFYEDIKLKQVLDDADTEAERKAKLTQAIDYTKRKSINLIGVRKDRSAEKKPMPYDVENFTFSQYYNEVERHDFEIEKNIDQQSRTTLDYAFAFQPKPVEPFQKTKFMKKSAYWKFLSDLNFNYLPSSVTFSTNVVRQNNEQQFRQVEDIGIGFEPLFRRNFGFNYQYGFNFNLTKSLKINYTAASRNIVKNYLDEFDEPIDNVTIWDGYLDTGTANFHMQQFILNYEIPLNKIPVLGFVKANYSYTGDYSWQKSSTALSDISIGGESYDLGNTVQNAKSSTFNTAFNMETLYKYLGIGKGAVTSKPKPVAPPKPGEKIVKADPLKKINQNQFVEGLKGVLTSIKNIQLTFTENQGTVLPGYTPSVGFFGSSKPTLGFVFGSQSDVRFEAAKRGWLTTYQEFNQNYTTVNKQEFKGSANLEIIPDLKIDLLADRSYSENFSEQYDVSNGNYNSRSPYNYGIFSISAVLIKTSFSTSNEVRSTAFDEFRNNRLTVANRLAVERGIDITNPANLDSKGFPLGFSGSSQAVLLPSFLAAYSGNSADKVSFDIFKSFPVPNWRITYNGLMRYEFFKKTFKRFSLTQNYKASYTVNSFRSNFNYTKDPNGLDDSGNYYSPTIMSNVTLVEQFNPLVRIDFELKNSFKLLTQINRDRALSMSFDNNLLTEVHGVEYVVGLGYRIKDVVFSSKLADNPTGIIKSDINIKADLTYRDSQTIVRYLDYDNNQLGGGQNIWTLNTTADYSLSKNLTIIFYYNHSFSKPVISTSFPLTNISSGFTFRYNFGN
ncbi:protein involved in gliding motility SprA [Flavobacterium sp. 1]|uniref:T9SS outer membrane translocon Sov/SprA n=1 Tax=Flavobacterium sp. 1 TaxID=2035200 RepID=UPI000C243E13|nr:cell surface protein SprA [Flavobacterium sp. 1]PJJ09566.1 protein involved in gliding motility SprA [Flavobacterium sp. 1]